MANSPRSSVFSAIALLLLAVPAAAASQLVGAAAERGTFLLTREGVPVGVERFTRGDSVLQAEVGRFDGLTVKYDARIGAGHAVERIRVRRYPPGTPPDGAPAADATIHFGGDSLRVEQVRGDSTISLQLPIPGSAHPTVSGSLALLEQLVRRARAQSRDAGPVVVPVVRTQGATLDTATVHLPSPDSARVTVAGEPIVLRLEDGRVVGGFDRSDGLDIERRAGHVGPSFTTASLRLPSVPADASVSTALERFAGAALRIPLASLSGIVLDRGDTAAVGAWGAAILEPRRPATSSTAYHFGSVGKQFTAAAIMQLVEAGRLSLDDPVSDYVPDAPHARGVTIRHLLTMTSGIPNYTKDQDVRSDTSLTHPEVLAAIRTQGREFEPGARFKYSNSNYYLLGMVIEEVAGRSYWSYLVHEVIAPVGVAPDALYACDPRGRDRRSGAASQPLGVPAEEGSLFARPYLAVVDTLVSAEPPVDYAFAAGGVCGTAPGLAAWMAALSDGRIVQPDSWDLMTSPGRLGDGSRTGYGFGLFIDSVGTTALIWHGGLLVGYEAFAGYLPEHDVVVALATNTITGEKPHLVAIGRRLAARAAGLDATPDSALLAAAVGTWDFGPASLEIRREGDGLVAQRRGQAPIQLEYQGDGRFVATLDPSIVLQFRAAGDHPPELTLQQGGRSYEGRRVEPEEGSIQ